MLHKLLIFEVKSSIITSKEKSNSCWCGKHDYILDGTKILRECWNYDEETKTYRDVLIPLYDNEDSVCGIIYNGVPYYFQKNLQGDVIGITNEHGTVVGAYRYDAWGANTGIITCTELTDGVDIANINPFRYRGYYFDKEIEMYYLQSRYYDPQLARFISKDIVMGANSDHTTYTLYTYCGNCPVDRLDQGGTFWRALSAIKDTVRKVLSKTNNRLVALGVDTAAIGACLLDMSKDRHGIYHARFNCWQQYFGYNDFYDFMFDIGTSMENKKFTFKCRREWYALWAWKGNYINLGAGAELGIYYGGEPHWKVKKSLAMRMSMLLKCNNQLIISHSEKTWWLTGFNPRYLNIRASDLRVKFTVTFNSKEMYMAFRNTHRKSCTGNDRTRTISFEL